MAAIDNPERARLGGEEVDFYAEAMGFDWFDQLENAEGYEGA